MLHLYNWFFLGIIYSYLQHSLIRFTLAFTSSSPLQWLGSTTHNMRQIIGQSIQYSGLVVFLLCNAVFTLWLLSFFRWDHSTAKRLNMSSRMPSSEQWSAGSAFFTVTVMCFGFYAQPPDSLLFSKSERVWRLSPLFVLADTIIIFWVWIYALGWVHQLYQCWSSFRTIAVLILIMQIANDRDALQETASVKKYRVTKVCRNSTVLSSIN